LPARRDVEEDLIEDVDDRESTVSPRPPSPPPIKALIQTTVQFDGKSILNAAGHYALKAFDFNAFTRKEVLAVIKHSNTRGYSYHRVSGSATIDADRVKAVTCDLDDEDSWTSIESIVEEYGQQKKKNIRVNVLVSYARRVKGMEAESDVIDSSDDEPAPRKKRRTATEKRKEEAEAMSVVDEACGNAVGDLIRRWRCEKRACINYGKTCYIVDMEHVHLNSSDLTVWNTAIRYGKATLEVPSGALFSALNSKKKVC
jgi:hypothetical protein